MKPKPSDDKPPAPADPRVQGHDRDEAREHRRDRAWRIAATQMAAPSTRRWRRAGTFGSTS